jgi:hypothetical protein
MDPVMHIDMYFEPQMLLSSDQQFVTIPELLPRKDAERMSNKANVSLQAVYM